MKENLTILNASVYPSKMLTVAAIGDEHEKEIGYSEPCHKYEIQNCKGFNNGETEYDDSKQQIQFVEKYGTTAPFEGEIGKIADVRYIVSTIFQPWTGVDLCGATGGTNVIQNASNQAHVYPILYIARDAYALVALKGKDAITPMVVNPTPSDSDPMAQRGHVSWKAMSTTKILNDAFLYRVEVACTNDSSLAD